MYFEQFRKKERGKKTDREKERDSRGEGDFI